LAYIYGYIHNLFFAPQKYIRVDALSLFSRSPEYIHLYTLFWHDPTFQPKCDDLIIPEIPDAPVSLPDAPCTFHLGAEVRLRNRYPKTHDPISGFGLRLRHPVTLLDNKLDRLEPFLQRFIILLSPIAHTHQLIAIPPQELLSTTISRKQG
jgi:hypothetical protein